MLNRTVTFHKPELIFVQYEKSFFFVIIIRLRKGFLEFLEELSADSKGSVNMLDLDERKRFTDIVTRHMGSIVSAYIKS